MTGSGDEAVRRPTVPDEVDIACLRLLLDGLVDDQPNQPDRLQAIFRRRRGGVFENLRTDGKQASPRVLGGPARSFRRVAARLLRRTGV
jgi:hypothetical protein